MWEKVEHNKNCLRRYQKYLTSGKIKKKNWLLPWGSIEYHGPHLPLYTDSIIAYYISKVFSSKINGSVLKPIQKAICFHMRNFKGSKYFSKSSW